MVESGAIVPMTSLPCFLLVRWLDDEMLSVISEKTVRQGGQTYVGAMSSSNGVGKSFLMVKCSQNLVRIRKNVCVY